MDAITNFLADLRIERRTVSSRLDAIDLVIHNIEILYPPAPVVIRKKRKKLKKIALVKKRAEVPAPVASVASPELAERKAQILTAIQKAPVGLTLGELRKLFIKWSSNDRNNALASLQRAKQIRRTGNTWAAA